MNQYDIKITGKDLKRFLKNLHNMKIQFYNISYQDKSMIIRVNEQDYKKIIDIKTIYEIEIVKLYGPIRIITFFKNYSLFFLFLILVLTIRQRSVNIKIVIGVYLDYLVIERYRVRKRLHRNEFVSRRSLIKRFFREFFVFV